MRGEEQIRAAARDDQVTAERNGNKRDWRRERLATLLDKLQEEVVEFMKDVMKCNPEGIRWEGSDIRWTVTMIQDHHGVLEVEIEDSGVIGRCECMSPALGCCVLEQGHAGAHMFREDGDN